VKRPAQTNQPTPQRKVSAQLTSWEQLTESYPGLSAISNLEESEEIEFRTCQSLALVAWHLAGCRGVIRSATGSGKTLIASAIAASMLPKTSLVLVHGRQLFTQTLEQFQRFIGEENVGFITNDQFQIKPITVASIDSIGFYLGTLSAEQLKRLPDDFPTFHRQHQKVLKTYLKDDVDTLIFDECHHGSADTWQKIGRTCRAFYRCGLSGTPLKHDVLDDMLLMSLVGPVVFDLRTSWLQNHGYLAPARLVIRTQDWGTPTSRSLDYQEARKRLLVQNKKRWGKLATEIAYLLSEKKNKILVLTGNSVDLAEGIADELEALVDKHRAWDMVTGQMSATKVNRAFERLKRDRLRCVITTKLADEGIDVPNVNVLLIVGGGKSYVTTVQRIGRGLRQKADGEELVVVDYFTKGNTYLEKHDRARLKTYHDEEIFNEIEHD
jgi:superfamily II DNA or RNA helicase